jgi:serine/threonine kinase PknH
MIRQTEQPARETIPEPMLANYRLDDSPRRREAGSLLFAATAPDGSPVALQVSAEPVTSRRTRARFRRLARARAEVAHPRLLTVREIGEAGGRAFAAAEPFPARSLAELLREGPLEPMRALRLLTAVADGLDAAHAAGVVHRTLSAESVLLDGESVKLDLFGVFTVVGQASWGDVVRRDAHLHYESPEGVRGEELVAASNVYSLTGLLVHALTGKEPFVNHDPVMITYAHLTKEPPKPSEHNPDLPSGLDAIVARGMAKDPAERPGSAGALITAAATVLRTAPWPTLKAAAPVAPKPATPGVAPPPKPVPAPRTVPPPAAATGRTAPMPAPAPVATESPRRPRLPLRTWLVPLGPVLLVLLVGAAFGVLLGLPGSGSEQAANTASSPQQDAVQRLDDVRFRLRDELAFAATTDEQAGAAQRLAMAYGRAADHMTEPALVSAAEEASLAYLALESAARAGDQDAYDTARARVEAAEKRLEDELAQINRSRSAG